MTTDQIATEWPFPRPTEHAHTDIAAVRSKATELEQQARTLIRKQPVLAVLAAAGLGFLAARIVARATR